MYFVELCIFSNVKAFQAKLKSFEKQLFSNDVGNFPVIARTNREEVVQNFVKCISESQYAFNEHFGDF